MPNNILNKLGNQIEFTESDAGFVSYKKGFISIPSFHLSISPTEGVKIKDLRNEKDTDLNSFAKILKRTIISKKAFWISLVGIIVAIILLPPLLLLTPIAYLVYVKRTNILFLVTDSSQGSGLGKSVYGLLSNMADSERVWYIAEESSVDAKTHAGAKTAVKTLDCKMRSALPKKWTTNSKGVTIEVNDSDAGKISCIFIAMPFGIFVKKTKMHYAAPMTQVQVEPVFTRFTLRSPIPDDANILGETWRYVNKDGGPDRRYANNEKLTQIATLSLRFQATNQEPETFMFSKTKGLKMPTPDNEDD